MKLTTLERIEELRLQLQKTAADKDLTDPMVVGVSEELDILIIEFYLRQKRRVEALRTNTMDNTIA
ncbi:aspartyl-phosphate phosphatase Spo0E family protein [Desulfosporosinus sp. SB140]|uniref:aspartyl-phosphate phosphatase Spo0E family protein n=1 Tax=Desulfosporosinus paludis TaxID=3115649 RepID=UPI0038905FA0